LKHCEFCDEFGGGAKNAFAGRYSGRISHRLLSSTSHFTILPTLGQIVEGHLLLVPTAHVCAVADLPYRWLEELEQLRQRVHSILTAEYGYCIFFEHGIRAEGSGGCGIDHAHLHAVPVAANGVLDVLRREFGGCAIHDFAGIKEAIEQESSYLFFEDSSASRYVFPVTELPSQYMRKLVADSIDKSDWDWRKCGQEPELIATLERLAPLFSPATIVSGE
jgi:diadenosine tetraphosphate (Ap4A) HIT family hydrolase